MNSQFEPSACGQTVKVGVENEANLLKLKLVYAVTIFCHCDTGLSQW
ncbi:hypothetical protein PALB_35560 [Pseudoalteromonas luteoviolacea B = ATCC 29581]|nr:hypothetical protein PALB_35560 [Pseudoalteromonas luteoviolacea B = ATCC 29581]